VKSCSTTHRSNAAKEELNTTRALDLLLVRYTLPLQVLRVAIQDVNVRRIHIDVAEEVVVHERVVGLRVFARDTNVFVLHSTYLMSLVQYTGNGLRPTMLKVTTLRKDISPCLCAATRFL